MPGAQITDQMCSSELPPSVAFTGETGQSSPIKSDSVCMIG